MNEDQPKVNIEKEDVPDPKQTPNLFIDVDYVGDPEELLDELKRRLEDYKAGHTIWAPIYYQSLAFFSGRQYLEWNTKSAMLEYVRPATNNALRVTINKIVGKVRSVASHMTSNLPTANVMPNSASSDDIYAARYGERWLSHSLFNGDVRKVYRETALANIIFGHSFVWTKWNEFGGKAFDAIPEMETAMKPCPSCPEGTPDPACQECQGTGMVQDIDEQTGVPKLQPKMVNGKPVIQQEAFFEGEPDKKALTPMQVFYPPETVEWEKCPDVVIEEFKNIDEIKADYPNCEDITWEDGESQTDNPWQMMVNFNVDKQTGSGQHGLMVYTYLGKASLDFPEGLEVVWIKDKVRIARPMKSLKGSRLPLSHSKYISIPGLLRGMGLVEILQATQTAYNKTVSQVLENNQRMNNVHWIVDKNACKIIRAITNDAGQIIEYEGSKPPAPSTATVGSIMAAATAIERILDATFDYLSGVPKAMEGFSDASINSGIQNEGIIENAKSIHAPEIDDFVEQVADSCSVELQLVQDNLSIEKLISFYGPDGRFVVDKFVGAKIAGNWNVKMVPGSALTESRASQVKNIEMLLQVVMNGQADPEHKKIIMEKGIDLITHGEKEKFVTETISHIMKVRRVIDDIKKGIVQSEEVPLGPDPMTGQPRMIRAPKVFMPWHAPYSTEWLEEIEQVLDSSEFDEKWDDTAKQTLAELWEYVSLKKREMMQQAEMQMPGAPQRPNMPQQPGGRKPIGQPGNEPEKPSSVQRVERMKRPVEGAPA